MNNNIRIVKSFMGEKDSQVLHEYLQMIDDQFKDFGNTEKEFKFYADIQDSEISELINFYGKRVLEFVRNHYEGPFDEYDQSKTHIARFEEGHGMHEHFDSTKPNDIATLIYINSNYEGGELFFTDHDVLIKPEPGDLVCFPDTPEFVHGVKPIVGGIRYTIPRWFTRIV
jgi:hypothetical protein